MTRITSVDDYLPTDRNLRVSGRYADKPTFGILEVFCQPNSYNGCRLPADRRWDASNWTPGVYRVERVGFVGLQRPDETRPTAFSVLKTGPGERPFTVPDLNALMVERELEDRTERRGDYWAATTDLARRIKRNDLTITYSYDGHTHEEEIEIDARLVDKVINEDAPSFHHDEVQWRVSLNLRGSRAYR